MIVNLTDRRADGSRQRQLDILGELGPDGIERQFAKLQGGSVVDAGPRTQPVTAGSADGVKEAPRRRRGCLDAVEHPATLDEQVGGEDPPAAICGSRRSIGSVTSRAVCNASGGLNVLIKQSV